MSKQANMVFGPESSGTRFVTSLFVAAGCKGDSTHRQRFDRTFPTADRIVWRRSFPHAGRWPRAVKMIENLRSAGYQVKVAVLTRDWYCIAHARKKKGHVRSIEQAIDNVREAYRRIFGALRRTNVDYVMISYEALVMEGDRALPWIMSQFGLHAPLDVEVRNGNRPYYERHTADRNR